MLRYNVDDTEFVYFYLEKMLKKIQKIKEIREIICFSKLEELDFEMHISFKMFHFALSCSVKLCFHHMCILVQHINGFLFYDLKQLANRIKY